MRVPPESRMVVNRLPSRHPLPLPVGEVAECSEDGEGNRQQTLSVACGDSSPKGRAKASYIGTRNGAYLYRYAPFTVLRLPLNGRHALFQISRRGCIRPYAQTNQQNRYPASTAISVNGTPMRRNSDVLTS